VLLVGALWYFWFQRGLTGEARRWLALARAPQGRARAQALLGAGTLAWRQGDLPAARSLLEESATLWRGQDDRGGLAEALHERAPRPPHPPRQVLLVRAGRPQPLPRGPRPLQRRPAGVRVQPVSRYRSTVNALVMVALELLPA